MIKPETKGIKIVGWNKKYCFPLFIIKIRNRNRNPIENYFYGKCRMMPILFGIKKINLYTDAIKDLK